MRDFMNRFMAGRNGIDSFSQTLFIAALVLIVFAMFTGNAASELLGIAVFGYSYFRVLSRNIAARSRENRKYLDLTRNWRNRFQSAKNTDREHKIFVCTNTSCSQKIRVPKGKGNIEITCPKCGNKFVRRT